LRAQSEAWALRLWKDKKAFSTAHSFQQQRSMIYCWQLTELYC